jgi:hypothetical protein
MSWPRTAGSSKHWPAARERCKSPGRRPPGQPSAPGRSSPPGTGKTARQHRCRGHHTSGREPTRCVPSPVGRRTQSRTERRSAAADQRPSDPGRRVRRPAPARWPRQRRHAPPYRPGTAARQRCQPGRNALSGTATAGRPRPGKRILAGIRAARSSKPRSTSRPGKHAAPGTQPDKRSRWGTARAASHGLRGSRTQACTPRTPRSAQGLAQAQTSREDMARARQSRADNRHQQGTAWR